MLSSMSSKLVYAVGLLGNLSDI
uniref:Uncharacterized protein n=1 Tax=Anguilla anguilla TaxID=7936 RepID=A0A0E9Q0T3_ANGAN